MTVRVLPNATGSPSQAGPAAGDGEEAVRDRRFYTFLHRQIPLFIGLSLLPGLGYLLLGWLNGILAPALAWYAALAGVSAWGWRHYRAFDYDAMGAAQRDRWYRRSIGLVYAFFLSWMLVFLLYVGHSASKLHYIAVFTEIGTAVVASSLLASDRRLYRPMIVLLMLPLVGYFLLIGEWYGYVLAAFAATLTGVLLYAADSMNRLLLQASHQASHDALTALYNRHYFIDHLQGRMNALAESGAFSYLLLIDLDHFKNVNDSLGHDVGDRLLQQVVERIREQVGRDCVVARLGGDEFVIAGDDFAGRQACEQFALDLSTRLLARLKAPYVVDPHHLYISASIGVSVISGRNANANRCIKEADIAMYEVKAKGRDGVFLFNDAMSRRVERVLEIERLLHSAVEKREIALHFQPQVDGAGRVVGAEALARWDSPALGGVSPGEFIPIAEQTGLILGLGHHVLETGVRTLREWHDAGIGLAQLSINISMRQFTHQDFVPQVEALVERHLPGGLGGKLVFEVTESIVAEDIDRVVDVMNRLKALGIRFSMDDFGTGYSSLSHLHRLPLDEIKIDRAFVSALGQSEESRTMVNTILNMAHLLKLAIVAEGVETGEQREFLLRHGCSLFQGYLYAKPMPADAFADFCRAQSGRRA